MDKLLSKKEVCALLGISTRTWDRWRALAKAKGIELGEVKFRNTVRWKPAGIQRLLDKGRL